jgi:two-component system, OmpR family, alkaline phosphatase synthesis response regulator PhoP
VKILIIDDEQDVRRIASLSLRHVGGFDVLEAASGAEGIEKATDEGPDAILLDVMMPAMDGAATLKILREKEKTRTIPVIFVTARVLTEEIQRFESLGVCGVITKPFNGMTLPDEVRRILGGGC